MAVELLDWPTVPKVRALTTTRTGGVSHEPYVSFNTAFHVGDDPLSVGRNREQLRETCGHPIQWLNQVHGSEVYELHGVSGEVVTADASMSRQPGMVCAVQTADCLPLLLCDHAGKQVAAVHAGWRGLAAGIITAVVRRFDFTSSEILAWLGPAISREAFEVGPEVYTAFEAWARKLGLSKAALDEAFVPLNKKYMADLYTLAGLELRALGINHISGGEACTWRDADQYYSWRREGVTGRMTSAIWIEP